MSLATKLVSLRKEKGLTQIALAEKLDVSRQAISRWEVGAAIPSTDNLKVLCELYGVSVDYLLNDGAENSSKHSGDQDVDAQNADHQDSVVNKLITDMSRLHKIIYIGVALIIVLLTVIATLVISPDLKNERITPIEDMTVSEDDDYPTIIFPID